MPLSSSCATPEFPPSVTDTKARRILADPSPELYFSSYLLERAKGVCSPSPLPLNRRHHNKGAVTSRASTNQRPDRPTFTLSAFARASQYSRFLRITIPSYIFIQKSPYQIPSPIIKTQNPICKSTCIFNITTIYGSRVRKLSDFLVPRRLVSDWPAAQAPRVATKTIIIWLLVQAYSMTLDLLSVLLWGVYSTRNS